MFKRSELLYDLICFHDLTFLPHDMYFSHNLTYHATRSGSHDRVDSHTLEVQHTTPVPLPSPGPDGAADTGTPFEGGSRGGSLHGFRQEQGRRYSLRGVRRARSSPKARSTLPTNCRRKRLLNPSFLLCVSHEVVLYVSHVVFLCVPWSLHRKL